MLRDKFGDALERCASVIHLGDDAQASEAKAG
jgi:hypothetical protein